MVEVQKNSLKSVLFVAVQFFSLGAIGLTGSFFAKNPWLFTIEMMGLGLGVWAVLVMQPGHFNITPDPLSISKLVSVGPYRYIRHPMYLALLLTTFPLVINHFTMFRSVMWLILLVGLLLKMNYEEGLLAEQLEGYRDYAGESYKIIPFLY